VKLLVDGIGIAIAQILAGDLFDQPVQ